MAKRQWSRAFTPRNDTGVRIGVNNVPTTLRQKFAAKCRRENKSQRNLLLGWIRNWTAGRRPDESKADLADDLVENQLPEADSPV